MRKSWLIALGLLLVGGLQAREEAPYFASKDGKEYFLFVEGETVTIKPAGSRVPLTGTFRVLETGEARVVTTENGSRVVHYYTMTKEGLRTDAGVELLRQRLGSKVQRDEILARKRAQSLANMQKLCLGLLLYTGDHDGRFPEPNGAAGLELLRQGWYLEDVATSTYLNPRDIRLPAPAGAPMTEAHTSYAYVGAGLKDDNPHFMVIPILIEKPTPDNRVQILFLDGHVEGFDVKEKTMEAAVKAMIQKNVKAHKQVPPALLEDVLQRARAADAIEAAAQSR